MQERTQKPRTYTPSSWFACPTSARREPHALHSVRGPDRVPQPRRRVAEDEDRRVRVFKISNTLVCPRPLGLRATARPGAQMRSPGVGVPV